MGGKSSTSTVKNEPPPEVMAAYRDLLKRANPVADTPYQAYTGGVNGSGFEQDQLTGFQNIANLAGSSNGAFGSAASALDASTVPTYQTVGQYMSPYIQNVVNSTMANMQEQNAQQQQGVLGNAIAQGAMGGNRVGVAQAELARQQNLANQATIANLYNTGYGQALSAAQAQQAANQAAAQGYTNLGETQMQSNLAQAVSQIGAGTQQQQFNYQQYQNERSYPFQTTSWLANIVEGLGGQMGGTQTTTQPAGNTGSGILGGLLGLGALFLNRGGAVHKPHRAQGGVIPYSGSSGIVPMNDNAKPADNDNGYVPEIATGTAGRSMPTGGGVVPQPAQSDAMLNQGMKSMESALQKKYLNGTLSGASGVNLPSTAPIPTPNPMTGGAGLPPKVGDVPAANGLLSGLASILGFADGGAVRRGYDAGGLVDPLAYSDPTNMPDPLIEGIRALLGGGSESAPKPLTDQQFNGRAGARVPPPQPLSDQAFDDRAGVGVAPAAGVLAPSIAASFGDHGPVPQPLSDDQRAANIARNEANAQSFGDNVGVMPAPASGVAPPLPSRTIQDRPEAPSVPEYKPERVSKYSSAFNEINDAAGLPPGYLNQTAYIESGFNPNADNGIARGAFQFTGPTAKQYGLSNPFDPIASAQAAARLASDNAKFLAGGLGREPTAGELYLAHQQGAAGALNLLTHPNAPATDIVGRAAVIQNGGSPDMTAAQFADLWTSRFNSVSPNSASDSTVLRMADNGGTGIAAPPQNGILVGPQPTDEARGVVSSILHGERPRISDDMRMALLSAGLGMMASKSPNMLTGIGEGGMQGIKTYMEKQQLNRENALAQSTIGFQQGQLGLEGKRVDIAGQQLALDAKRAAAEIAEKTALTGKTNLETQAGRYQVTQSPAGYIIRDVTNPLAPPKVITYDQMFNQGEVQGAGNAPAQGGAAPAGSPTPPPPPSSEAPVKAAPIAPVGAPPAASQPSGRVFADHAPTSVPVDPRLFSSPDIVKDETKSGLDQARKDYQGAINTQTQLSEMQHDLGQIQNSAWTSPGTGFESRVKWARAVNTAFNALGVQPPIDENAVAAGENLNKLTTRLGFSLSSSLGSGEAARIVDQAVASVPGGANSKEGAARIIAGIQAANQRKLDYYNFLQDWSAKGYGSIKGADQAFNQQNPPELYAIASYVPTGAIQALRADPSLAPQFEQKYGLGTAKYVLGTQ